MNGWWQVGDCSLVLHVSMGLISNRILNRSYQKFCDLNTVCDYMLQYTHTHIYTFTDTDMQCRTCDFAQFCGQGTDAEKRLSPGICKVNEKWVWHICTDYGNMMNQRTYLSTVPNSFWSIHFKCVALPLISKTVWETRAKPQKGLCNSSLSILHFPSLKKLFDSNENAALPAAIIWVVVH